MSSSAVSQVHVQPALVAQAIEYPDQEVRVIVQKQSSATNVEAFVPRLGGQVIRDLAIINAFVAQLPAAQALELARMPGVTWVSLDGQTFSATTSDDVFITWANKPGTIVPNGFTDQARITDSGLGPNQTYGAASKAKSSVTGFSAQTTPGYAITKVEAILHVYTSANILQDVDLKLYVNGKKGKALKIKGQAFASFVGSHNVGQLVVDVTDSHRWQWSDFDNNLELVVDQDSFKQNEVFVYYDAIGLRVTSAPGTDTSGGITPTVLPREAMQVDRLRNTYNQAVRAPEVWNTAPAYLQGQGLTVAVIDSGVFKNRDLEKRVLKSVNFSAGYKNGEDRYGHGTFVAGIIAGDGKDSQGEYIGIAPKTNLLNVRISNDEGMSLESDVVAALQWVLENKDRYNIRVINLSLNAETPQSYHTSPLAAACEILWFNGIVVVVSAGNNGVHAPGVLLSPADDPFVITVGATDDRGTPSIADDQVAAFSAFGTTPEGFAKPEIVAPGRNIVGLLPENKNLSMSRNHSQNRVNQHYFRMSGTSMAAPIVAGAVALLLQDEPYLTPDQVKFRLMATAAKGDRWSAYSTERAGAGYLDIFAAIQGTTTQNQNTNIEASRLLWTGTEPVMWGSVKWGSVNWGSVKWGSVNWGSVKWGSVKWGSDHWEETP
jgi:serine protease AprX